MTRGENVILIVASRWITPLAALFACLQLASWPASSGVGAVAGLTLAMPIALNALLFGVRSVLVGIPALALRVILACGLGVTFTAAGLPNMAWSAQLAESGAFGATAAGITLILLALMGRAGALKDAAW
jgi:hypothetical protein